MQSEAKRHKVVSCLSFCTDLWRRQSSTAAEAATKSKIVRFRFWNCLFICLDQSKEKMCWRFCCERCKKKTNGMSETRNYFFFFFVARFELEFLCVYIFSFFLPFLLASFFFLIAIYYAIWTVLSIFYFSEENFDAHSFMHATQFVYFIFFQLVALTFVVVFFFLRRDKNQIEIRTNELLNWRFEISFTNGQNRRENTIFDLFSSVLIEFSSIFMSSFSNFLFSSLSLLFMFVGRPTIWIKQKTKFRQKTKANRKYGPSHSIPLVARSISSDENRNDSIFPFFVDQIKWNAVPPRWITAAIKSKAKWAHIFINCDFHFVLLGALFYMYISVV